jgi:hypothetical protein
MFESLSSFSSDIVQLESKRNWRTSILGPFEDFDVIPVTSLAYKTMFDGSGA